MTDKDGRCPSLLEPAASVPQGVYKITFFTKEYFQAKGVESFYPFVEVSTPSLLSVIAERAA